MSKHRIEKKRAKRGYMSPKLYRYYKRSVKELLKHPESSPEFELAIDGEDFDLWREVIDRGVESYRNLIEDDNLQDRTKDGYRFVLDGLESIQFDLEMNFDLDDEAESSTSFTLRYGELASLWWELNAVETFSGECHPTSFTQKYKQRISELVPGEMLFVYLNVAI